MLDDALFLEGIAVDDVASLELLLETGDVDGQVLHTVEVAETRELRQTHRERGLATLETGALAAASARQLTIQATASGLAIAGAVAATDALAILARALCRLEIFKFHVVVTPYNRFRDTFPGLAARRQQTSYTPRLAQPESGAPTQD